MVVTAMEINKQSLFSFIIFNENIKYNDYITLHPIKMKDIIAFQQCQLALTLRKNAIFHEKNIIKMEYLTFIKFAHHNQKLADKYNIPLLRYYYYFAINLLRIACGKESEITYNTATLDIYINGFQITDSVFDDLRKIMIIQNDIDFDIDEFMNIDTINALEKAREFEAQKSKEKANIEDYIDSLIIEMKVSEEYVSNMTIRKFWRYIKRINRHDEYNARRTGQMSGMVTFKEPIQHWMTSIDVSDKYENLKTNEDELRSKIV